MRMYGNVIIVKSDGTQLPSKKLMKKRMMMVLLTLRLSTTMMVMMPTRNLIQLRRL